MTTKIKAGVIGDGVVGTTQIAANAVTSVKLAQNSVLTKHIDDNQIGIDQLNVSDGSSGQALTTNGSGALSFATVGVSGISSSADATAITIDSSERIGIPAIGQVNVLGTIIPYVSVNGQNADQAHINIHRHRAAALGGYLSFSKSRSATKDFTIVQDDDPFGTIDFQGADGNQFQQGAQITAEVDGNPAANTMPGRLVFKTTTTAGPVERTRINSGGAFKTKQGTSAYANSTSNYNEICSNADATANLLVRQGSTYYADCINLWYYASTGPNNVHSNFIHALDEQATRAKLYSNGGFANYQSNDSNLCDEREKKNIVVSDSTWNDVKSWNIKKFHYNEDENSDSKRYGVIAQDIEKTNPELITDWEKNAKREQELWQEDDRPLPDGVSVGDEKTPAQVQVMRKAVKEQQMYIMAIKALQEAMTEIESLKARIETLEG